MEIIIEKYYNKNVNKVANNIKGPTVLYSMSVTFGVQILVKFPSNHWFIRQFSCLKSKIFTSYSTVGCLHYLPWIVRTVRELGEGGRWSHGRRKIVRGCAHKIILTRSLLCQSEARFQVPISTLVLQGNGKLISEDHLWVWPCIWDCKLSFNPSLHVRNGFIHFLPPSQEHYYWFKPVGVRVSVAKFDVDYGVGMYVP